MENRIRRRQFIKQSSFAGLGFAALGGQMPHTRERVADKIILGIMGVNGRGLAHIENFLALPNTEIAYVCDVDSRAVERGLAAVADKQVRGAQGVTDFRRILDDPSVDALSIAAPNHWHATATILACAAGKHVYVEKPGSHNPREGELMVAAARKYGRLVQMGTQRRSWPWVIEAMNLLFAGEIGRVLFARTWYNNRRAGIGHGEQTPVPEWLDYSLWQGPAPERPFKDNLVHYNWHWHWHWGNGELGNNGIHVLDLARWGLGVDCPVRVTCGGGKYHHSDDQETPDTYVTTFDFGDKGATWESHSSHPHGFEGASSGVIFYGDLGSLVITGDQFRVYDLDEKPVREGGGLRRDIPHFANFLDGIHEGRPLNSEIEEAQKSTLLCHLGNIAFRTGRTINLDPATRRIIGDPEAESLWTREYRGGWEPEVN